MISAIIEYSLRNRFLVLALTVLLVGAGVWSLVHIKLDAIPDLSDVQVIVTTEYPGQNPQVVDDQVTYPLSSALLAVPGAKVVRGYSMFEQSFVYVLFEDGTDIYLARSRVLEYLNFARDRLPKGVEPKLGPDATGVGWVYQYVLYPGYYSPDHPKGLFHDAERGAWYASTDAAPQDRRNHLTRVRAWESAGTDPLTGTALVESQTDLAELRSLQDWYLRYPLTSVEDVSEVASIGGFVKQYQIVVDPLKLKAYGIPLRDVMMAVQRSNNDVGGATIELSENEYMVRSRGYLRGLDDIRKVVVGMPKPSGGAMGATLDTPGVAASRGTPILLGDVANVQIAGEMRRGIGEYNGTGEAVGGIVIARFGANAYQVVADAKAKLHELEDGLPPGIFIKTTYDRSELIGRSVATLRHTLIEEVIVVGLVCILFLLHARSELVAVFVVPSSVIVALLAMHLAGINANIMSLGGLAIAIGVVVDSAIIMVENAHKHLDREEGRVKLGGEAMRQRGNEGMREDGKEAEHQGISGSDCVAEGNAPGEGYLSRDQGDAVAGAVRTDESNAPGGSLHSIEHRGGIFTPQPEGLSQIPEDSTGLVSGTSNPTGTSHLTPDDSSQSAPPGTPPRGASHPAGANHKPDPKTETQIASSSPHSLILSFPHSLSAGYQSAPRLQLILQAAVEVGPQLFFSLLIITVSFLPVFVLEGEAGRLFKPLAFTKTFAMAAAAFLSITIIPVLMFYLITSRVLPARWGPVRNTLVTLGSMFVPAFAIVLIAATLPHLAPYKWWIGLGWAVLLGMLLIPQKIIHEDRSPISNLLQRLYSPVFSLALRFPVVVVLGAVLALASTYIPLSRLGTEFMPPLDEGDLLYMPTADPSLSISTARGILQQTDKLIKTFPEVLTVHGKIGRAETATDPAPMSMVETVVQLKPDRTQWRSVSVNRFYDNWPSFLAWPFKHSFWPTSRPITVAELKFGYMDADGTPHPGLNSVVSLPGIANAWPYPIENRINMLATGIKTPVGIKIFGPDLETLGKLAEQASSAVRSIPGTVSSYPERTFGGYYLDIDVDRDAAARYGLTTGDVQDAIQSAVGGMNITTTVEGLQRYPLNLRFARDYRDDIPALKELLVATPAGAQVPLGQIAAIAINPGPPMIRSENAQRTAWVYVDITGRDLGGYIAEARKVIARDVPLPPGYTLTFAGTFEMWERTLPRLIAASLITLVVIVLLLYVSSHSWFRVIVVMLAVPFSLIGAFWFMDALGYNLSLASVVGMIALAGLDAETGMIMLLYLDNSVDRFRKEGRLTSRADLWHAVHDGAVMRIRPKAMTVAAAFIGLVPLLWAEGTGADTMRRIAAPMIGGLLISFAMELILYPVIYYLHQQWLHAGDWSRDEAA